MCEIFSVRSGLEDAGTGVTREIKFRTWFEIYSVKSLVFSPPAARRQRAKKAPLVALLVFPAVTAVKFRLNVAGVLFYNFDSSSINYPLCLSLLFLLGCEGD